jgi:phosphopantothenoylcysteine decarboxylase/phosphopantothenate--cysteine ligase
MLKDKTILVGVSGGIAAYKSATLVSRLRQAGARVLVVMTPHATQFVAPLTLQTLSGHDVYVQMFPPTTNEPAEHVWLGQEADLVVVAPATANIIGKAAAGIADDLLSTTIMAAQGPVLFAPAMHERMYRHPVVQDNIARLRKLGYHFVGPGKGRLARGDEGEGRLAEIDEIMARIGELLTSER